MASIYPTHTCFDDAAEYIAANPFFSLLEKHEIVHAICIMPNGEPYAHAWVEHKGEAISAGILAGQRIYFAVERGPFYEMMRVLELTRYSINEAVDNSVRFGGSGPWLPKYRELCSDDRRVWSTLRNAAIRYEQPPSPGHDSQLGDCVDELDGKANS